MIIQCPNCETKYNFDESRLENEVKVRCSRCKHVFKLSALGDKDEPKKDKASADFSLGAKKKRAKKVDQPQPEWDPDDMNVDIIPSQRTASGKKKILTALLAVAAILIIGMGIYYLGPTLQQSMDLAFLSSPDKKEDVQQKPDVTDDQDVRDISLENIRQYFVSNDKIGQLFVIEGQAVNNFSTPKSMIKLRASLYDAQGEVVVSKDFLCGNVASLFQLQVSSEEELESVLESRLGILATNKHIEHGDYTLFMAVFYNPPEELQEFGIEVIEAREPTP